MKTRGKKTTSLVSAAELVPGDVTASGIQTWLCFRVEPVDEDGCVVTWMELTHPTRAGDVWQRAYAPGYILEVL